MDDQQEIFVESLKNKVKRNGRTNSRRLKRNAPGFYSQQFINSESINPNAHISRTPRYTTLNNNPWQSLNLEKRPFLNNWYLPVAPEQDYMKPL